MELIMLLSYCVGRLKSFFASPKQLWLKYVPEVRSAQAIDRILALIALTYLYCIIGMGNYCLLGCRLKDVRAASQRDKVAMIYNAAKNNVPLTEIFTKVKIA